MNPSPKGGGDLEPVDQRPWSSCAPGSPTYVTSRPTKASWALISLTPAVSTDFHFARSTYGKN